MGATDVKGSLPHPQSRIQPGRSSWHSEGSSRTSTEHKSSIEHIQLSGEEDMQLDRNSDDHSLFGIRKVKAPGSVVKDLPLESLPAPPLPYLFISEQHLPLTSSAEALRELVHQFEPKLFLQTSRCLDYYL
jgi:hypothetical protein